MESVGCARIHPACSHWGFLGFPWSIPEMSGLVISTGGSSGRTELHGHHPVTACSWLERLPEACSHTHSLSPPAVLCRRWLELDGVPAPAENSQDSGGGVSFCDGTGSHSSSPRLGEGRWEVRTPPASLSLTGLSLARRLPEHGRPSCQGQLWAAGPDTGTALGQREHRLLWGRSLADHRLRLRHRCLLCQPAHPVPPL